MDAQIFKVVIVPRKIEDGEVKKEEYARLTFDVPIDSQSQRESILDLLGLMRCEFVALDITAHQMRFKTAHEKEAIAV